MCAECAKEQQLKAYYADVLEMRFPLWDERPDLWPAEQHDRQDIDAWLTYHTDRGTFGNTDDLLEHLRKMYVRAGYDARDSNGVALYPRLEKVKNYVKTRTT